ncbi:hypothetical protein BC833DRAFT_602258 [Globomyces pollinis-pini]|nr:hypothetical protein BC833DRAFT_602258 [Globomyces pollinis-pini]
MRVKVIQMISNQSDIQSTQIDKKPSKQLLTALETFPISNVIQHKDSKGTRDIVSVHESTNLESVLRTLSNEHILAVPIYRNSGDLSARIFTGVVSVYDILSFGFFQEMFDKDTFQDKDVVTAAINRFKKSSFFQSPISEVIKCRREEPIVNVLSAADPISTLLKLFTTSKNHRVLVISSGLMIDSPIGPVPADAQLSIISQMDLVKYFQDTLLDKTKLPASLIENVFSIPLYSVKPLIKDASPAIAIKESQSAMAGFNIMHINNVHAVPVINNAGTVVGTLSASDLRGLNSTNLEKLTLPVLEFLEVESLDGENSSKLHCLDVTDGNVRVSKAVEILTKQRIHHLWITNKHIISGVITLTDVLSLFQN